MLKMRNNKDEKNLEDVFKEFKQYCNTKQLFESNY